MVWSWFILFLPQRWLLVCATVLLPFMLGVSTGLIWLGDWPLLALYGALMFLIGRFCVRGWRSHRRHADLVALGRQYAECVKQLPELAVMLDREDHKVFACTSLAMFGRWPVGRLLHRLDEDSIHELGRLLAGERSAIVMESFHSTPLELGVSLQVGGSAVVRAGDGNVLPVEESNQLKGVRGFIRFARNRAKIQRTIGKTGLLHLNADELRQLLDQLNRAERLSTGENLD
jgi:hypothetical protein